MQFHPPQLVKGETMTLAVTPIIRYGTKKVCHVISDNTSELIDAANYVNAGWGVRDAGTKNEHLTVTPRQASIILTDLDAEQLEQDIYYYEE